jgi:S1-C subfamily serine protease
MSLRSFAASVLALLSLATPAPADLTPDQIRTAKRATVLVELPRGRAAVTGNTATIPVTGKAYGSAFCVDPAGLFVTNGHVASAAGANAGSIRLVLSPGEADQKVVNATVLRSDASLDLAVLRADDARGTPALQLGSVDRLIETTALVALGFPFGGNLAFEPGDYPSVSVNTGRITSLRKRRGELELIQLDAALNPGNSGGPVLDPQGNVVGVVQAGVRGSGVNFAIPVSHLSAFLRKPEFVFAPAPIPADKLDQEREFTLEVISLTHPRPTYSVEVTLAAGDSRRTFTAAPAAAGAPNAYTFKAVPAPAPSGPKQLRVTARYTAGSVVCRVADRPVTVADQKLQLADLRRFDRGQQTTVTLASGKSLTASPQGLESVPADLGDLTLQLDLSKASSLTIEDLARPVRSVGYTVTVKEKDAAVARLDGTLEVTGTTAGPTSAPALADSAIPGAGTSPAPLEQDKVTRKLPGAVDDVIPAAGGRLLLLHLKKLRKLAVFDAAEARVTQFITLASDDVLAAAGADKLVIIYRDQNLMQRWDLRTLQKELTVPLPAVAQLDSIALGYASAGPLLLMTREGPRFLDVATLKLLNIPNQNDGNWRPHPQYPLVVRASADGTTFAAWEPGLSPAGIRLLTLDGNTARDAYQHESAGLLLPSPDGSLLFTSNGIYSADLKPTAQEGLRGVQCIPAYHPSYFLTVRHGAPDGSRPNRDGSARSVIAIYTTGDRRLLVTLSDFDELKADGGNPALTIEKRIHLLPAANLLVTLSDTRDELILRRFSITDVLEKAGIDYLFVASTPSRTAEKGQTWSYRPDVKSKRGGVKVKLESGPEGMKISSDGKIEWPVPPEFATSSAGVILNVSDASGQEVYHTFNLTVR